MNVQLKSTDFLKFGDVVIQGDLESVTYKLSRFYQISELSVIHTKGTYILSIGCNGNPAGCISVMEMNLSPEELKQALEWFKNHNVQVIEYD